MASTRTVQIVAGAAAAEVSRGHRDAAQPARWPSDRLAFLAVIATALTLLAIDPPGYVGGHWDDGRYLDAALRWVAHGPVMGTDHWALRWPVVLPAAWAMEMFGRTRGALMMPGIIGLLGLVTANFWAARRVFGLTAAIVASLALLTTSEILLAGTRLTADIPEALFWTASLWAFVFASRRAGTAQVRWLIACGLAAGLAVAVRETSLSLIVALAAAFVSGRFVPRHRFGWIATGFLGVFLPEQLMLWHASGDALYRLHTDLRHIDIASTNMRGLTAAGQSAPLNMGVAARWQGVGPVHLNWVVDPWINLFLNAGYGLDFLLAGAALLALRLRTGGSTVPWRSFALLAGLAALHIFIVVYVVATDPKPRMFMPSIVGACLALGIAAPLLARHLAWLRTGVILKLALLAVMIDLTAVYNIQYPALAAAALRRVDGPVHANRWTLSVTALADPALRARLREGNPPVGGTLLTTAKLSDPYGDARPDPALNWQWIAQVRGLREPVVASLGRHIVTPGSKLAHLIAQAAPAATLYRRLPDTHPPILAAR